MAAKLLAVFCTVVLSMNATFAQQSYEHWYTITEEAPAQMIGNLVQDTDLKNAYTQEDIRSFEFSQLSGDLDISVNSFGDISTNGSIDRDTLCPGSVECIRTIDYTVQMGVGAVVALVKIRLTIEDINDITPQFPQVTKLFEITETSQAGQSWRLPVAVDNDSPSNGITDYRLEQNSDVFELRVGRDDGGFDLLLTLIGELDRETRSEYILTVLALDPQQAGQMRVTITIKDSNDNPPVFESDTYVAEIVENAPQSYTILTVRATDRDINENGRLVYGFDTNTQDSYGHLFGIDGATGDVEVTGVVDYEQADVYRLIVVAHDMGADSLQATTRVTVNVLDDNDSPPDVLVNALGGESGSAHVIENAPLGAFVAQVLVSDADSGDNGRVTCTLNDNVFELQKKPGENEYTIQTASELDRERTEMYNLAIMCQDHGESPQRTLQQLAVNIGDVNDQPPTFSSDEYRVSIDENSGGGVLLTTVSASDEDIGINAQLSYSLSQSVATYLYVTTTTEGGEIRTIGSFDREATPEVEFTLYATDGGDPQLTGSVVIIVTIDDVNDERPRFSHDFYEFRKEEEQLAFLPLGEIHATDLDSFPSNVVTYSLAPQFIASFDINPQSGELKSRTVLDRETNPSYEIVAIATDHGTPLQSSSVTITLELIDINDNPPVFQFPNDNNNTVYIPNHYRVGTLLTQVLATDNDEGAFGRVSYVLEQAPLRQFNFNTRTGDVTLATDLSDVDYREYTLFISARDQDNTPHITYQTLHINVNKTLLQGEGQEIVNKPNEIAVIAVACVAGTLIVILGLGIAYIVCRRRQALNRKQQGLRSAFVTISPQKHEYAQKQECIHAHQCPHDVSYSPPLPTPTETDGILRKDAFTFQRTPSAREHGIDNPGLSIPTRTSVNPSPIQDEHLEQERDTSSAEGSNADSGRGGSDEGESQSHISLQHAMASRKNSGPRLSRIAQFTDAHLGFETPGRRLLYNKTGSHPHLNQRQHSPQAPPIPPHEPFTTRSSGHLPVPHAHSDTQSLRHDLSFTSQVHRTSSYRTDNPVKYVDDACSKDVYV